MQRLLFHLPRVTRANSCAVNALIAMMPLQPDRSQPLLGSFSLPVLLTTLLQYGTVITATAATAITITITISNTTTEAKSNNTVVQGGSAV